jgi:hypothetical protein
MISALLLAAAACNGDCRAESLFLQMERKLLSRLVQLEAKSHAEGSVQADATADLSIGPAARVHATGTFQGKPFEKSFDQPATPALRDAFVLGLTRMGLLHNVVRLAHDQAPDHADGTVRDWLRPVKFRRVRGGVRYAITVGGTETGETTLLIDAKTKLPRRRTAVIHFPGGDMRVTESYRFPVRR